jgi:hypothetical protein
MVNDIIKQEIIKILGDVDFEGHFDKILLNMNENTKNILISWIESCKNKKEPPAQSKKHKELIAFFFKPNMNNIRGILTKKKNSFFIALFLDNHKYYDRERKKLGY